MHVAVSAVGPDRPGIVAAVAAALFEVGGNLEDSRMAILGGHFALVLIADVPSEQAADALRDRLRDTTTELGLSVTVGPVAEAARTAPQGDPYIVSVYGADRPGIVARVSGLLAQQRVNITDLATHVGTGEEPLYVMVLEVTVPAGLDPETVEDALRALAAELSVDVSMHPMETDNL